MGVIRVLPEALVNKIAAGEVIERPASVLKELLENALDADAGRISIEIEQSGQQLIRVSDNGKGMTPEDLGLAIHPHATSKIAETDDLFRIKSYGFRGEALASIAAVSYFTITSRPPDAQQGRQLTVEGGKIIGEKDCGCAVGSIVEVRQLFFNTPARRKFQKSKGAEMSALNEMILRVAIPHPDVEFRLFKDGVESMSLPAVDSARERLRQIFGSEHVEQLLPVQFRGNEMTITGFVASTGETRGNTRSQYFFLNGRFIRDATLISAISEAYFSYLTVKRFAVAYLFLEMDPEEFDVNVHPAKLEVRFRDARSLFGAVSSAVKETLRQSNLLAVAKLGVPPDSLKDPERAAQESRIRKSVAQFFEERLQNSGTEMFSARPRESSGGGARDYSTGSRREYPGGGTKKSDPCPSLPAAGKKPDYDYSGGQLFADQIQLGDLRFVATLHNNYLLFEMGDGFLLVDQHALHERILYNILKKKPPRELERQPLLIPEVVELSPSDAALAPEVLPLLNEYGFEAEDSGNLTLTISCVPQCLNNASLRDFVKELFGGGESFRSDSSSVGIPGVEDRREVLLKRMACHGAVRSGQKLKPSEVDSLVNEFFKLSPPYTCPHGRPALITFPLREIEKMFKRT